MARRCTVCHHDDRAGIERDAAGGRSQSALARDYGLDRKAIARHLRDHTTTATTDPLDEIATSIKARALKGDSPSLVREYRLALSQMAARNAQKPDRPLAEAPEWVTIRKRLTAALQPFPEAREAVAAALLELDA